MTAETLLGTDARRPAVAGAAACLLALLLVLWSPRQALGGWLSAFLFWTSVPIGALVLVMMMRLIPGKWTEELAPTAEAAMLLLPLGVAAVLPVLLGMHVLYDWTQGVEPKGMRAVYLTPWFFVLRTALFWAGCLVLAALLMLRRSWSTPLSCAGLILFVLAGTTMAVDWLMSLEPDFHSSGYGLYVVSIQMTIGLAALMVARLLAGPVDRPGVLGGLLLTALLLWAYFSFMQYFIIWSGNLPQGVRWYETRTGGGWTVLLQALTALHLLPTVLLLFTPVRRSRGWLLVLGLLVLAGKAMECLWLVLPALGPAGALGFLAAVLGLLGLGLLSAAGAVAAGAMARRLRPVDDDVREAAS
ncbi:MAG TPA: hypothetical protein VNS22_14290 [Geminicoccus sp.]|uniref:hypothetical protein n=1 Tax=Geminicoccus sp. TaxID=2024832 RepID=UPI002CAB0151|nr:hypothetical protein [Geminicoccus sp.]HWL69539.1 hypothetical protein [Geminicoccus sp.]